jgi:hypothetical protein
MEKDSNEIEEENLEGSGLSDDDMTDLLGELETLFKSIDWDALAETEEDLDDGVYRD